MEDSGASPAERRRALYEKEKGPLLQSPVTISTGRCYALSNRILQAALLTTVVLSDLTGTESGIKAPHPETLLDSPVYWDSGFIRAGLLECEGKALRSYVMDLYLSRPG